MATSGRSIHDQAMLIHDIDNDELVGYQSTSASASTTTTTTNKNQQSLQRGLIVFLGTDKPPVRIAKNIPELRLLDIKTFDQKLTIDDIKKFYDQHLIFEWDYKIYMYMSKVEYIKYYCRDSRNENNIRLFHVKVLNASDESAIAKVESLKEVDNNILHEAMTEIDKKNKFFIDMELFYRNYIGKVEADAFRKRIDRMKETFKACVSIKHNKWRRMLKALDFENKQLLDYVYGEGSSDEITKARKERQLKDSEEDEKIETKIEKMCEEAEKQCSTEKDKSYIRIKSMIENHGQQMVDNAMALYQGRNDEINPIVIVDDVVEEETTTTTTTTTDDVIVIE